MKNKKVKQMMAVGYDNAASKIGYWCKRKKELIECARFMRGEFLWWPSCDPVSLTARELKGE